MSLRPFASLPSGEAFEIHTLANPKKLSWTPYAHGRGGVIVFFKTF